VAPKSAAALVSEPAANAAGAFSGAHAVRLGVSRDQLAQLRAQGVIERALPDTYTLTAVRPSDAQRLWAALLWAGDGAAAAGRSEALVYGLEGRHRVPRLSSSDPGARATWRNGTCTTRDTESLMLRTHRGVRVTGPDDPLDYERDHEKWSVPARHGYKLVLATWEKVVSHPGELIEELRTTLAA